MFDVSGDHPEREWGRQKLSLCDLLILVDAEPVVWSDVVDRGCRAAGKGSKGSGLAESAARPAFVVVALVLTKHGCGPLVDDQDAVEELAAEGADEAFGDGGHPRAE